MNPRRAPRSASLLALLPLLLAGCDSSSPTDPLAGLSPYAGDWSGASGQGRAVAFTVGGSGPAPRLTRLEFSVQIDELLPSTGSTTCLGAELTAGPGDVDVPIVDGTFEFEVEIPAVGPLAGASVRFAGRFDSTTAASGELSAETPPTGVCVGRGVASWTARRL